MILGFFNLNCSPSPPSTLPQMREMIRSAENLIRQRSRAAEVNWSSDKCQQSATGEDSLFVTTSHPMNSPQNLII